MFSAAAAASAVPSNPNVEQLGRIFSVHAPVQPSPPPPPPPPSSSQFAANSNVHDFSITNVMLLDETRCSSEMLQVEEISRFTSALPISRPGSLVVSNGEILAYSLKEGSVRLIHRDSGMRALTKAHKGTVNDMLLVSKDTLFTCGEDGTVAAWSITFVGEAEELQVVETLRLRCKAVPRRIVCHPRNARILFIAQGEDVTGIVLGMECVNLFNALPDRSAGVPIEHVAKFRAHGAHQGLVNEVSFNQDGSLMLTAGEDEIVYIWSLAGAAALAGDALMRPVSRIVLGNGTGSPINFARYFGANSIIVGFSHSDKMVVVDASAPHQILATARFANVSGAKVNLRAQLVNDNLAILCDANSAMIILLELDEHQSFRRAVTLLGPQPVHNYSLTPNAADLDSVAINVIGASLVLSLTIASLQGCFQASPSTLPPAFLYGASGSSSSRAAPVPAPTPPAPHVIHQQQQAMQQAVLMQQQQQQYVPQRMVSSPPPSAPAASASPALPSPDLDAMDRLLQSKMDALLQRLELSAKQQLEQERERSQRLLEVVAKSLLDLPEKVRLVVSSELASPQFQETLAQIVQAKLQEPNKSMEKTLKYVLPNALDKFSDQVSAQVVNKLALPNAFEQAFSTKLVPAFEVGVRDMMAQFEDFYSQAAIASGADARKQSLAGGGGGGGAGGNANAAAAAAASVPSTPDKRAAKEEQIQQALHAGDVPKALQVAVRAAREDFPDLLLQTCDRVDFVKLLGEGAGNGITQNNLVDMLPALANVPITAMPTMELRERHVHRMEAVGLALEPESREISKPALMRAASEAKDALQAKAEYFAGIQRFRALGYTLDSLANVKI